MTSQKKPGRPKASRKSKTPKKPGKPQPGKGWVTREHLGYAIVWFFGLAMGAWLF